jgi:hypothetical protein
MMINNREPAVYFPHTETFNPITMKSIGLTPVYQDCWLTITNLKAFPFYKSELEIEIIEANKNMKNDPIFTKNKTKGSLVSRFLYDFLKCTKPSWKKFPVAPAVTIIEVTVRPDRA